MPTLTEWTAIVLLGIGVLKMIIGLISPKLLLDYKRTLNVLSCFPCKVC